MSGSRIARRRAVPARAAVAPVAVAMCIAGCSGVDRTAGHGSDRAGGGTVVISTAADADNIFPPLAATTLGRVVSQQIFEPLASVGDSLNVIGDRGFRPQLADNWNWAPDSLSIVFHLNPRARWHDGVPVRASDVVFSHRIYTDSALASPGALLLANIDSVTTRDSLTPVVWFRHRAPQQFYSATEEMAILPEHVYGTVPARALAASDVIRHPVGSGRFRFRRWTAGSSIELTSNAAHYRAPARLDRVIWTVATDFSAAAARVLNGEADFFEYVRPEMISAVQSTPTLRLVETPGFKYGFMALNLRAPGRPALPHPIFGDRGVRRALTMALDRHGIVRSVFDTLAVQSLGPVVRSMPTTDTAVAPLPFDPAAAERLLDSLGWRRAGAAGVRQRRGTPLEFTILTPSSSKERGRLAVELQEQLRRVGIGVKVQSLELNALMQQLARRDFDAVMVTWAPDPAPDAVRQSWGSAAARARGSANYSGYANPRFDAQLDSAASATTLAAARPLFTRAYQTIVEDAPAVWLFEPRNLFAVQKRIHLAPLRPDAWWAHLADWYIPPDQRIARDFAGGRTTPLKASLLPER